MLVQNDENNQLFAMSLRHPDPIIKPGRRIRGTSTATETSIMALHLHTVAIEPPVNQTIMPPHGLPCQSCISALDGNTNHNDSQQNTLSVLIQ